MSITLTPGPVAPRPMEPVSMLSKARTPDTLTDGYGRELRYLRFSLTEACNMSCTYCLPEGFPEWYRHKSFLDRHSLLTLLEGFRLAGFDKVRFTGGEPTLHPGCLDAVKKAAALGFSQVCMTTNGLSSIPAATWRDAGLTHVNVSLDSLRADTFQTITKSKQHERVMAFIEEAIASGLKVKINTVLLKTMNGSEAKELMAWAMARPITLRFIELMPTGLNNGFDIAERVGTQELMPLAAELGLIPYATTAAAKRVAGPESPWFSEDHPGRVGFISPMSCNFCGDCNRLRVTAKGQLKMCLFSSENQTLPTDSPEAVVEYLHKVIVAKPERHHLEDRKWGNVSTFRTIGG